MASVLLAREESMFGNRELQENMLALFKAHPHRRYTYVEMQDMLRPTVQVTHFTILGVRFVWQPQRRYSEAQLRNAKAALRRRHHLVKVHEGRIRRDTPYIPMLPSGM